MIPVKKFMVVVQVLHILVKSRRARVRFPPTTFILKSNVIVRSPQSIPANSRRGDRLGVYQNEWCILSVKDIVNIFAPVG